MKLNQILALEAEQRQRTDAQEASTRGLLRTTGLAGIARTYQPRTDAEEQLPPESVRVQFTVDQTLNNFRVELARLFDLTATKEWGNTQASADLVVDGILILADVPVTYLLFLEKQLSRLEALVRVFPVLDPAEDWHYNSSQGWYETSPQKVARTRKIPRNHVLAEATQHHPAQVQVYHEDIPVGDWSTTKFSGNLPAPRFRQFLSNLQKLQDATRLAREEANSHPVTSIDAGQPILDFLFS